MMTAKEMAAEYLAVALSDVEDFLVDRFVAISVDATRVGAALTELTSLLLGGIDGLTRDDLERHKATLNMLARHHTVEPEVQRMDSVTIAGLQAISDVIDRLWECLPVDRK